jgi:hypothetical protein
MQNPQHDMQTSNSIPFNRCKHQPTPMKQRSTKHLIAIVSPVFFFMAVKILTLIVEFEWLENATF